MVAYSSKWNPNNGSLDRCGCRHYLIKVALRRFSKPPPSKTVLTDEISVRQTAVPRTITARPPWPPRRNNCEFSLRCFCVVRPGMMGHDGEPWTFKPLKMLGTLVLSTTGFRL